ncbi:MAG: hypothetical protein ABF723_10745 [Lentilactobacillus hilgardii]|uniref:hypothetical protein n=2 Tax=Lentilactobacillus hilgardii TaxID=1588 RepID=UPI001CC1F9FC|nr:hypothetical protein [Lentilactobacillus hilgardii]MBZ2199834.1 hypothetical protein [Lentilactobacillus hilgardii]MBZ2205157.1 hypothetical protein [Lentilactobacillus hilgardii]
MNVLEDLERKYPELHFEICHLPCQLKGLTDGNYIYLSDTLDPKTLLQTAYEEVEHALLTAGDILDTKDIGNKKQEVKARDCGHQKLITLDGLIYCANHWFSADETADHFGVTVEYLYQALGIWRQKKGLEFNWDNYHFDLSQSYDIKIKRYD